LLDLGFSQLQVAGILHFFAILFIVIALVLRELRSLNLVTLLMFIATLLTLVVFHLRKKIKVKEQ
jgi:NADH:ubiquinone oxidoreductase subunit 3 (subunit A)